MTKQTSPKVADGFGENMNTGRTDIAKGEIVVRSTGARDFANHEHGVGYMYKANCEFS